MLSQANSLQLRGRKLKVRLAVAILNKVRSAEIDGMCVFGVRTDHSSGPAKHKAMCIPGDQTEHKIKP